MMILKIACLDKEPEHNLIARKLLYRRNKLDFFGNGATMKHKEHVFFMQGSMPVYILRISIWDRI